MGGASQTNVVKKDQAKETYIYIYTHTDLFYFKCIIKNNTITLYRIYYIYICICIISAYCSIPTVAYNYIATII